MDLWFILNEEDPCSSPSESLLREIPPLERVGDDGEWVAEDNLSPCDPPREGVPPLRAIVSDVTVPVEREKGSSTELAPQRSVRRSYPNVKIPLASSPSVLTEGSKGIIRRRYTFSVATPSPVCHLCCRPRHAKGKKIGLIHCNNLRNNTCLRGFCERCLTAYGLADFKAIQNKEIEWVCTHCSGCCPPGSRCEWDNRRSEKRRENKNGARYKDAIPSKFCHTCTLSALEGRRQLAPCSNLHHGLCLKTVCSRCFEVYGFGDFAEAKRPGSGWTCPHCQGVCPERAQCAAYAKSTEKRKTRKLEMAKESESVGSTWAERED